MTLPVTLATTDLLSGVKCTVTTPELVMSGAATIDFSRLPVARS